MPWSLANEDEPPMSLFFLHGPTIQSAHYVHDAKINQQNSTLKTAKTLPDSYPHTSLLLQGVLGSVE